jgi:hypothetical protein
MKNGLTLLALAFLAYERDAFALKPFGHGNMTAAALDFLETEPHLLPETDAWTWDLGPDLGLMNAALTESAVNTDFRPDTWMRSAFHDPAPGVYVDGEPVFFTSLLHFLDPASKTRWGGHTGDGFSHRLSTDGPNDSYVNTISLSVDGASSAALGGDHRLHPIGRYGFIGAYVEGFKGYGDDYQSMFDGPAGAAFFPPATLPAEHALRTMLGGEPAAASSRDCWVENFSLISGITSTTRYARKYCRETVRSLPRQFDLLGITLHMGQDMVVPQHTQSTVDLCHAELEDLSDTLDCGAPVPKSVHAKYADGSFQDTGPLRCRKLYDPALVRQLRAQYPFLDPRAPMTVSDRMMATARETARWHFANGGKGMTTTLPGGASFSAKTCSQLLDHPEIRAQLKIQYNLGVALSVALFEQAAHAYAKIPRAPARNPASPAAPVLAGGDPAPVHSRASAGSAL